MRYSLIYILTLVAANLVVAYFGPASTPVVAFVLIGLDLTLRDRLHDQWQGRQLWPRMLALIATAGLLSYVLNPTSGPIAIASVVAFGLAALADAVAYQFLAGRSWTVRANGSNVVGAAVDSLVFPFMAFGAALPSIVFAQWVAKVVGGMVWALVIARVGGVIKSRPA
jgi:uncharacterized PurR-regulated membrane protein YhhQ (DUF165 family)